MAEAVKEEGANDLCRDQGPATHSPLQSPGEVGSLRQVSTGFSSSRVQDCPGTDSQVLPGLCLHPEVVRVRAMTDGTAEAPGQRASTRGTTEVTGRQVAPRA